MLEIFKSRSLKTGLPPGTFIHVGEQISEEVRITLFDYNAEGCEAKIIETLEDCIPYKDKDSVTWVNVDGLHEVSLIERLCNCFTIHPLTIEDILNTTQRPKIDYYDNYIFLVVKANLMESSSMEMAAEQVSFILGKNFLLTFQEKAGDTFEGVRNRIKNNKGRIRKMGADYLAYALLDSVVDNYFTVLERLGEEIEDLEEELVTNPHPGTLQRIHFLKRTMIMLRRSIWPLREVISGLHRDESEFITEGISFFLKDLYDHTIQVIDTVETFRDMIAGMLDIYLSSLSNRMNEVMKVLTIFAAIFIPLTFIAGLYGMNFNTGKSPLNMPELNWYYGYPFVLGLMAAVGIIMLIYFKKKKWF